MNIIMTEINGACFGEGRWQAFDHIPVQWRFLVTAV
jgi:hypothetical protein